MFLKEENNKMENLIRSVESQESKSSNERSESYSGMNHEAGQISDNNYKLDANSGHSKHMDQRKSARDRRQRKRCQMKEIRRIVCPGTPESVKISDEALLMMTISKLKRENYRDYMTW